MKYYYIAWVEVSHGITVHQHGVVHTYTPAEWLIKKNRSSFDGKFILINSMEVTQKQYEMLESIL